MQKFIFFTYLFLFSQLYCENKFDFSFALIMNIGEHQEKVFDNGRILSLLQWPILPSMSLSLSTGFYFPYCHINFESAFGIPSFSGNMKDSDYTDPTQAKKTLFSSHRATLNKNIVITPSIGIPFKISNSSMQEKYNITIEAEPQIGFYFSLKNWHAKDGYTQYKSNNNSKFWHESWPKKEYKGKGVQYIQKIFFPFIAFNTKIKLKNKLNIALNLSFSPLLQGEAKDIHFDTKKIYIDSFTIPSYSFEIKTSLKKGIAKKLSLYTSINFIYVYSNKGKTTVIDKDTKEIVATYPTGSSGIEGKEVKLVVGINFTF